MWMSIYKHQYLLNMVTSQLIYMMSVIVFAVIAARYVVHY